MGCLWSSTFADTRPQHWIDMEELIKIAHTGDILLFSGLGLTSMVIRAGSDGLYSHVGMIVLTDKHGPCVWESSKPDGCWDVLTKSNDKDGPRLIPLRQKLMKTLIGSSGGTVHYRRLIVDQDYLAKLHSQTDLGEKLWSFMCQESPKNFEWNWVDMARSAHPWIPGEEMPDGDPSGRFCSELVAATWREMGFLHPQTRPSDLYTVSHFAQGNEKDLDFPAEKVSGGGVKQLATLGSTLDVVIAATKE